MRFLKTLHDILTWTCGVSSVILFFVTLCVIIADYNQEGNRRGTSFIPGTLMMIYFAITAVLLIATVV